MHTLRIRLLSILAFAVAFGLAPLAWAEDDAPPPDEKAQAKALVDAFHGDDLDARLQALKEARSVQHESLLSPLVRLLADKERGVREAAIEALAERAEPKARKKAATSLGARLSHLGSHPAERAELMQVIGALKRLAQPVSIDALLDDIDLETDLEEVEARLFAVAEVPDKKAIEGLIDFLAKGRRGGRQKQRDLAHKALRYATGETPGEESRTAGHDADRWRAWWRDHEKGFDFEAVAAARAEQAARAKEREARKEEREARKDERKAKGERKRKKDGDGGKPGGKEPKDSD